MKMTRSHFEAQATLCADIIADLSSKGQLSGHQISSIVSSFCDMCSRANPKFDKSRFCTWVSNNLDGIKNN